MKVIKLVSFLFVIGCCSVKCYSQSNYKQYHYLDKDFLFLFGVGAGGMNCLTDVGGANSDKGYYLNEVRARNTRLSASIFGGIMYHNFLGLRLEGTWGKITSADDQITTKSSLNLFTKNVRNLKFKSNISEIALLAEFHPLMLLNRQEGPLLFSPYLVTGVGYYSFHPQAPVNGTWVDLKPLHTEGEGFAEYPDRAPYSLSQVNVPVGLGLRYELSTNLDLRLDVLQRVLFTDYLDDVSSRSYINSELFKNYLSPTNAALAAALANPSKDGKIPARRGNPDRNDSYMTISFKISWTLGKSNVY